MEFEKRKKSALAAMVAPTPDKSPKGTLDSPIVPLLHAINRHPSFFTTSSCSGRISILSHPSEPQSTAAAGDGSTSGSRNGSEKGQRKGGEKKKKAGGGRWVLVTHDPVDPQSVVDLLFGDGATHSGPAGGTLVFRFEPFILAVECRDAASAQLLVSTAISCGFRESGITNLHKRVMVAIRCSIRLELPLGEIGRMMVPPEYVIYLVKIANEKMIANRKRTDCFLQALQCKSDFFLAANDYKSRSTQVNIDVKRDLSVSKVKQTEQVGNVAESCSGLHGSYVQIMDTSLRSSTKKSNLSCELEDQIMDETVTSFHRS
ncbi:hypothetical protein Taro_018373, partial [Colocasia esculenta]|nr:hypothetical protein [Colocasia esculenta]